ncbi:HlyD family secretion protein [Seinonella peptonophila]|uniref:HlyD family secretion protein n=1 Tax=Seinonella peptonophila TaxID=112248 RepID=A0A1M4XW27_9BACL|nr:efflux RND transporter periplasmic adaptor subunit [Seinonella peptonophila]SHE97701.1 HlyD family secretion protein [Seinonella peptonophila]
MNKKKKVWIGLGILAILGIVGYFWMYSTGTPEVKVGQLSSQLIQEKLTTTGTIATGGQQDVYLQADRGEMKKIWVDEGQKVVKGSKLVELTNPSANMEVSQAEIALKQAKIKWNNLQKQKKREGNKSSSLKDQIQLARLELEQARKQLRQAKLKKDQLIIKSKQDGIVAKVNENAVNGSNSPQPVVIVADINNTKIEAKVSEYDALKLKEDQQVVVTSDALPGKEWMGRVRKIGILPDSVGSQTTSEDSQEKQVDYPVEIGLDEKPPMKIGSRVIVEVILTSARLQAIPQAAVRQDGDQSYVFVVEKRSLVRKNIKVGKRSDQYVQIISGITTSDQVVFNPTSELTAGKEVIVND